MSPHFYPSLALKHLELFSESGREFLIEEVIDCGPAVDLASSPGCRAVPPAEDQTERPFPDCCLQFDCEEGADVKYYEPESAKTPRSKN